MTAQIISCEQSVVTLQISGTLAQRELAAAEREAVGLIRKCGRIRLLVLMEDFDGWEQGAQWSDFSFQLAHDSDIERMAIVGEEKWRDPVLLFSAQGLRTFPLEFFPRERLAAARTWLNAAARK